MRDDFRPRPDDVESGIRIHKYKWVDTFLGWEPTDKVQGGSYVNGVPGSKMTYVTRPFQDQDRLQALRVKQEPAGTWDRGHEQWIDSLEWPDKDLGIIVDKNDAYEAHKVMPMRSMDETEFRTPVEYVYPSWTSFRVKACLRAGGMLPYHLLRAMNAQTQWTTLEKAIAEVGELPPLSDYLVQAVYKVRNAGYRKALDDIMKGDIAEHSDRKRSVQQTRALNLVAEIVRSWEALDYRAAAGGLCQKDRQDGDLPEWKEYRIETDPVMDGFQFKI